MISMIRKLSQKLQANLALKLWPQDPAESERGTEIVQMALVLALVVIVAIGILQILGVDIAAKLTDVANALH
jgi:hypothetical protein